MADEEEVEAAEASKGGGKKKMILAVVGLLAGAFVAKTMFLKPPPPTQAELDAAAQTHMLEVWAMCAAENEQPFDPEVAAPEIEAIIEARNAAHGASHGDAEGEEGEEGEGGDEHADEEAPAEDAPEGEEHSLRRGGGLGYKAAPARVAVGGGGATSSMHPIYENDEVTLNLADGHYVKVQVALQLASTVDVEALSVNNYGARAQDMVNERLSGLTMEQLQDPAAKSALKHELGYDICRDYDGEVSTIYFVQFVTQ